MKERGKSLTVLRRKSRSEIPPAIYKRGVFVHDFAVATKTITLELDAYEKLRASKRPGESFSAVVRRANFGDAPAVGADLRAYYRRGGSGVSEQYLDEVEAAIRHDSPPADPWA